MPGNSGYHFSVTNYFRPGPGGPTSNESGDFSGIYPNYVGIPDAFYCPSGPWRADSPWGNSGYTAFYGHFPWHGIWGRYTTYDYLGNVTTDFRTNNNPPIDINGDRYLFATSIDDESGMVLVTDYNNYQPADDAYSFTSHPPASGADGAVNPRDGLNVGHLDASVIWKAENDTVARYQWETGQWHKF